jgi:riboflavin synthase
MEMENHFFMPTFVQIFDMFTGIIETMGVVHDLQFKEGNMEAWIDSPFNKELKIDQSVAHDGVCLTVDAMQNGLYRITAIQETLGKTNLNQWFAGKKINLERAMVLGDRLDGHIVQGHVDGVGSCVSAIEDSGSWKFTFTYPDQFRNLIIEKGSICVNGISLTAFGLEENRFSVAIIPYTFEHTNIADMKAEDTVNLEFDLIGKYIQRIRM